jgi:hypothetical protein
MRSFSSVCCTAAVQQTAPEAVSGRGKCDDATRYGKALVLRPAVHIGPTSRVLVCLPLRVVVVCISVLLLGLLRL